MTLTYYINEPSEFSQQQKDDFLSLLKLQNQIENPNLEKINSSILICLVYQNDLPIGIGAIKNVYKTPFEKAGLEKLKDKYDFELGYMYVRENLDLRGLGIGKMICQLLLKKLNKENIFATTEVSEQNKMMFILEKLGFVRSGKTYLGRKTKKTIGLYLKTSASS